MYPSIKKLCEVFNQYFYKCHTSHNTHYIRIIQVTFALHLRYIYVKFVIFISILLFLHARYKKIPH